MKVAAYSILVSALVLTGCQSPSPRLPAEQAPPAGVEFKRSSRVYEQGDAMFAVMNNSTRVLWFEGQGPEDPAYRLKLGSATGELKNAPVPGPDGLPERFPLLPGESSYFEIAVPPTGEPASVGVTFYPSRSATNGMTMWSPPVAVPPKAK